MRQNKVQKIRNTENTRHDKKKRRARAKEQEEDSVQVSG